MEPDKADIFRWEMWGGVFISMLGTLSHFIFEWTGKSKIAGIFSAINDSTWEHVKMAFWPLLIWAVVEMFFIKTGLKNFLAAKAAAAIILLIVIAGLFYGCIAVFGRHFLVGNIAIFYLAVFSAQYTGYLIMSLRKDFTMLNAAGALIIAAALVCFILFTFKPPKNFLFLDPVTGTYGMQGQVISNK